MRTLFSIFILSFSVFLYSQSNDEALEADIQTVKTEVNAIKADIKHLKSEIAEVKSDNLYLRKVLDINKPILEVEKNNINYRITQVTGNKVDKTITIVLLFESKDGNYRTELLGAKIIDLEGNLYSKLDYNKSTGMSFEQVKNVPLKVTFTFKNVNGQPKILKLLKFTPKNKLSGTFKYLPTELEFRDLNVTWD